MKIRFISLRRYIKSRALQLNTKLLPLEIAFTSSHEMNTKRLTEIKFKNNLEYRLLLRESVIMQQKFLSANVLRYLFVTKHNMRMILKIKH